MCSIYHLQEHEFTFVKMIELDQCLTTYKERLKKSNVKDRIKFGMQLEKMMKINDWINPTKTKK